VCKLENFSSGFTTVKRRKSGEGRDRVGIGNEYEKDRKEIGSGLG
jgi:hypothetical protein